MEAHDFSRHLARARAMSEPPEIRAVARRSWFRRWCAASCCAAQTFAISLPERRGTREECALTVLSFFHKKETRSCAHDTVVGDACGDFQATLFGYFLHELKKCFRNTLFRCCSTAKTTALRGSNCEDVHKKITK